jgi:mono/diheme cytochrome c family protein
MRNVLAGLLSLVPISVCAQDIPACPEDEVAQVFEGEAAFVRFCRACHSTDQILKWMARQPDGEGALVAFLDRHGSCPPSVDAAIAAYLASLPAEQ